MRRSTRIIYWLSPAESERELFRELIRILARQFDAPRFDAHLTLFATTDRQSPKKILQKIKQSPIRLRIRGIGYSSKYTKTFFVRFYSNRPFEKLMVGLSHALNARKNPPRDPHVSLIYKKLSVRVKKEL